MKELKNGEVGLVIKDNNKVFQIALSEDQHRLLTIFLAGMSKEHPFAKMGDDYELVLKKNIVSEDVELDLLYRCIAELNEIDGTQFIISKYLDFIEGLNGHKNI